MDLKSFIVDDTFEDLRASLLHSGRGRPKAISKDLPLTNRLLVQLSFLREEGDRPLDVIRSWLLHLYPYLESHVGGPTWLFNLAQAARKKFGTTDDKSTFLDRLVDVNGITPSLSEVGITRSSIRCCPSSNKESLNLRNEVIVDLDRFCSIQGLPKKLVFEWISALTGFEKSSLPRAIGIVLKNYAKLSKNVHRDKDSVLKYLNNIFQLPNSKRKNSTPPATTQTQTKASSDKPVKTPKEVILRLPCLECSDKTSQINDLMETIKSIQTDKKKMELEIQKLKNDQDKSVELSKHKNDQLESKHKKEIDRYCDQIKVCKVKKNLLKKECRKLTNDLTSQSEYICQLESKLMEWKSTVKNLRLKLKKEKKEINLLKQRLENKKDLNSLDIDIKGAGHNQYNKNVRKTVLALQCDAGVSSSNVSRVIDIVSKNIFNHEFSNLPSRQTCNNICDEGLAISNMQVVENVLKSNHVTLHSDGTSRDHKKIVGHQFSLDSGETFFLGFSPTATEDAASLLDLTVSVIQKLADSFSDLSSISTENLLKDILSKITSTMTDRAAAMKSFDSKFYKFLQSELGSSVQLKFLHCNAHFLLGLSSACEKAINSVESSFSQDLGRDKSPVFKNFREAGSATNRVIRAVCNLLGPRGDQKNGCRSEWLAFCSNSLIPSFKSNRFNCFFQAAAAIIFHHSKMITFFTSGILRDSPNNLVRSATLDIQDDNLMCFVCAVALFYLKISGPYWKLVNSDVKYSDFHIYVQKMFSSFQKWSEDPSELMQPSFKSVFHDISIGSEDDSMFTTSRVFACT